MSQNTFNRLYTISLFVIGLIVYLAIANSQPGQMLGEAIAFLCAFVPSLFAHFGHLVYNKFADKHNGDGKKNEI